jgi:enoyl-CoA hydratase/carnithine racemase
MPGYHHRLQEKDPAKHMVWLTINRPQRRNALNDLTATQLSNAIEDVCEGR